MNVALRSDSLNILSICTGGAGLDLGLELAVQGARTVCMVEREAFAVAQLVSAMEACLLASAPIWSDARTFNGRQWRGAVDGLIGGIPCQPHSLAGKRLAEEDERDLWSTARRIIVQSGVWFVLIENVRGMLSSGGAERVRRDLHRLGFAVEGGLFTASEVGASHERERLFILAVSDRNVGQANADGQYGDGARIERQGRRRQPSNGRTEVSSVGLADANSERLEGERPDDGTIGRQDARGSAWLLSLSGGVMPPSSQYAQPWLLPEAFQCAVGRQVCDDAGTRIDLRLFLCRRSDIPRPALDYRPHIGTV